MNRFRTKFPSRRELLFRAANGFGGLALSALLAETGGAAVDDRRTNPLAVREPHFAPRAKNVVFLFMDGGPSHVDLFDYKPALAKRNGQPIPVALDRTANQQNNLCWGSPFKFHRHGESGAEVSELLPETAKCADDLCIIRSMVSDHSEHTAGNYFMHSGSGMQGRPSMGAWVTYGLGSESRDLPGFVVLDTGMIPPGGIDVFGSGFLPASYQGMLFRKGEQPVADIRPQEPQSALQRSKLDLVAELDRGAHDRYGQAGALDAAIANYELAFRMQSEVPSLSDLSGESEVTRRLYGLDDPETEEFGRACLLTRRMLQRGVRFVELLSPRRKGADRWDQHGRLEHGLAANCKAIDRPIAALIQDLKAHGLLEETLLIWGGEFGRTPTAQGDKERGLGRDHHPYGFTMWLAGGGVRPGLTYGATDEFGHHAVDKPVHVHDLHATILHLLGLDHKRLTFRFSGRDMRLTDVHGQVVHDIVA